MTEPKRHHYVPLTYLENFSYNKGDEKYITAYFKHSEKPININCNNVALETNLYTFENLDGQKYFEFEKYFATKIENFYAGIYKTLKDKSRTILNKDEKEALINFVVALHLRTPKIYKIVNSIYNNKLENHFDEINYENQIQLLSHSMNIDGRSLQELKFAFKKIAKMEFLLILGQEIVRLCQKKYDDIIMVTEFDESIENTLITSDNPVIAANNNVESNLAILLPIDKNTMLGIKPDNRLSNKNVIMRGIFNYEFSKKYSTIFNKEQYRKMNNAILGTEIGIENFLKVINSN